MPTKYLNPTKVKPGDTVYDESGKPHTVSEVIGNMIATTDGKVEIVPVNNNDDDD